MLFFKREQTIDSKIKKNFYFLFFLVRFKHSITNKVFLLNLAHRHFLSSL